MTNDVEAAQAEYLNAGFPREFRDEIKAALAEYDDINAKILAMN